MPTEALWVDKYAPRRLSEVIGWRKQVEEFVSWFNRALRGEEKRPCLLVGPPGVGKTAMVHAFAREHGVELIELNASDERSAEKIRELEKVVVTGSITGRPKLLFLDEIDGMSGTADRGGVSAILRILKISRIPVAMAANDPYSQRLRPLRDIAYMIRFHALRSDLIAKKLKQIAKAEDLNITEDAIKAIAERSGGSLRSAINDLQALSGKEIVSKADVEAILGVRDVQSSVFDALNKLFKGSPELAKQAFEDSGLDPWTFLLWVKHATTIAYSDPKEVSRAFDSLSKADIFLARIIREQEWGLLKYAIDLMTIGVNLAGEKPRGFTKWGVPSRFRFSREEALKSALVKIAKHTHTSTKEVRRLLPLIKVIASRGRLSFLSREEQAAIAPLAKQPPEPPPSEEAAKAERKPKAREKPGRRPARRAAKKRSRQASLSFS